MLRQSQVARWAASLLFKACTVGVALGAVPGSPNGKELFEAQGCAGCHGADGQGGIGKKLPGNASLADASYVIAGIIHGRNSMPAFGSLLSDEQIAAVATYVRTSFGNSFGAVQAAQVETERKAPQNDAQAKSAGAVASQPDQLTIGAPSVTVQQPKTAAPTQEALIASAQSTDSWLMYNKSYDGHRYSGLKQINGGNAGALQPVCAAQLGAQTSLQSMPIVYDGIMYITSGHGTYALDATNCRAVWSYMYVPKGAVPYDSNRGVAISEGRVYRGTADGHMIALDAKSGQLLWNIRAVDSSIGYFLSAAPIVWNGAVFMGTAGADWGAPGKLFAFDVKDGHMLWSLSQIDESTFGGAEPASTGGGATWSTVTLDAKTGKLYVPVGNPAPDFSAKYRPGKNLYTDSIIVVDAKTGKLDRYYQQIPNDTHDYDTVAAPIIFRLPAKDVPADATGYPKDGAPQDVDFAQVTPAHTAPPTRRGGAEELFMAVGNKEGHIYLYNDTRQELVYRVPITSIKDSRKPPTEEGVHSCPGLVGGVEWYGPAFNPESRNMYVGSVDWCAIYTLGMTRYSRGQLYMGGTFVFDPTEKSNGWVTALDAASGALLWKYRSELPVVASVTATAGGVLFAGELTGDFIVLDQKTGQKQYQFYTGGPIAAGVATYEIGGRQYVTVPSGNTSRTFSPTITPSATVFIFALPKSAANDGG